MLARAEPGDEARLSPYYIWVPKTTTYLSIPKRAYSMAVTVIMASSTLSMYILLLPDLAIITMNFSEASSFLMRCSAVHSVSASGNR